MQWQVDHFQHIVSRQHHVSNQQTAGLLLSSTTQSSTHNWAVQCLLRGASHLSRSAVLWVHHISMLCTFPPAADLRRWALWGTAPT